MADSLIEVTGGSGINVDTRTESTNSNHRQVVVMGDPSDNAGVAPVDATTGLRVTVDSDIVNVGVTNTVDTNITNAVVDVGITNDVTVTATNLDVRDLDASQDNVAMYQTTNMINNGVTALTPKFVEVDLASSGDNAILNGVAGRKIRVLNYSLVCGGSNTLQWKAGTSNLTGDMAFDERGGIAVPYSPVGHFETGSGVTLTLNTDNTNAVSGHLTYLEV